MEWWKWITVICGVFTLIGGSGIAVSLFKVFRYFGERDEHTKTQDKKIAANCNGLTRANAKIEAANEKFAAFKSEFQQDRYVTHDQHFSICEKNMAGVMKQIDDDKAETNKSIDRVEGLLREGESRRNKSREEDVKYREDTFRLLSSIEQSVGVMAANHSSLSARVTKLEEAAKK